MYAWLISQTWFFVYNAIRGFQFFEKNRFDLSRILSENSIRLPV